MKLHNTMSRQIEDLQPLNDKKVSLYTCGPTVYDYLQIGNWATFVRWDTLVRVLQASGYNVDWVVNITDVGHLTSDADEGEDKLEKGAKREGKTAWQVAEFYTKDFLQGIKALNIQLPRHLVKATDHIPEQLDLIKRLEKKGLIYHIDDGVYFDTSKIDDYGKLARLKLTELRAGARVEVNPQKHNPTDFALWKFSPKQQKRDMEWDSPWGKGFPGWHLECSAMAMKYLGETIDIHAGGIDHIPVHHTNEIAQSEGATDKDFAKLWLHSNFITVDGVKLSKSLGNSYTLQDIMSKGFDALDVRMLFLQSHYRSEANFTWEALEAARNRLKSFRAMADLRWQPVEKAKSIDGESYDTTKLAILKALSEDLNTPLALKILSQSATNAELAPPTTQTLEEFNHFIKSIDDLLGLTLLDSNDITDSQKKLILQREKARQAKNFAQADTIRGELTQQGISLRDTNHGPIWYRL